MRYISNQLIHHTVTDYITKVNEIIIKSVIQFSK
jgi:hypothetical protein